METSLLRQIARCRIHKQNTVTGRHMHLKDLIAQLAEEKQSGRLRDPEGVQKKIMKRHGQQFKKLPVHRQQHYERQAAVHTANANRDRADEARHLQDRLDLTRARRASEQRSSGTSLSMSRCRFTDQDLRAFTALLNSEAFKGNSLAKLLEAAGRAPGPPPQPRQDELTAQITGPLGHQSPKPAWLSMACRHRVHFRDSALAVKERGAFTL